METTTLGKTGLKVSRLGIGLVQISELPHDGGRQAKRVLGAALDAGINFFDTAPCYGISEELIGQSIAHRRGEFILATKAGHVTGNYSGKPWTAQTVTDSIDRSLRRMKTDYLDLLQLHAYDVSAPPPDEVLQAVLEARDAGKTRFLGYSQENEEAEWAIRSGLFDTLQTSFNLVDQRARHNLFEPAGAKGVGIIAKRPVAKGAWGKVLSADVEGGPSGTDKERFERARAMVGLGPIHGAPEDPMVLALGFVLAHDQVHTAIVGTGDPDHLRANVEAVEKQLPISEDVVSELHRRFDQLGREWPSID